SVSLEISWRNARSSVCRAGNAMKGRENTPVDDDTRIAGRVVFEFIGSHPPPGEELAPALHDFVYSEGSPDNDALIENEPGLRMHEMKELREKLRGGAAARTFEWRRDDGQVGEGEILIARYRPQTRFEVCGSEASLTTRITREMSRRFCSLKPSMSRYVRSYGIHVSQH